MRAYLWNLLIALDQFANAILGGDPDETLSSRAERNARQGSRPWIWLCRALHVIDRNHCAESYEPDEGADETIRRPWWLLVALLLMATAVLAEPQQVVNYDAWRFWLEAILALWALASTAVAWWVARTRATRDSIREIDRKVTEVRAEVRQLETEVGNRPDHQDLGKIYERLASMDRTLQQLVGNSQAQTRLFELMQEHMMGDKK